MRKVYGVVLALFVAGLMLGVTAAAPSPQVGNAPTYKNYALLTPKLFQMVQNMNWDQDVSTIIMFDNQQDKKNAITILKFMGAKIKYDYKAIPAVAVTLKVHDLLAIAGMIDTGFFGNSQLSGVQFIQDDYKIQADVDLEGLDESTAQISAPQVWNVGYDGSGVTVAVVDTGIDASHPDLQGKVIGWKDFVNNRTTPYDDQGHGTHVAGIIASTGAASNGQYKGVAPGAKLVGVKVLNSQGSGSVSTIIAGIDWVIQNKDKYNISVINLSLGGSQSSDGTDALSQEVDKAWEDGIAVCVAAGNSGPDTYTVGSPAAAPDVITVGAVDKNDVITYFSSRGPTADGRLKPEVVAPGNWIISDRAAGTQLTSETVGQYYVAASGTSMATPHVSGAVALLREAHPDWTPDKIKYVLEITADVVNSSAIAGVAYGAGRINVYEALNYDQDSKVDFTGYLDNKQNVTDEVSVSSGTTRIAALLTWDNPQADLDLYMYDPNGQLTDYSDTSYYGFEKVAYRNPTPGTWYFLVVSYSGSANYKLEVLDEGGTVSKVSNSGSGSNGGSSGSSGSSGSGSNGGSGTQPSPQPTQSVVVKNFTGTVDYQNYVVDTVTVNSGATQIEGYLYGNSYDDLDLYLYDPNQNLVTSSTNPGSDEYVSYNNPSPGTWYFVVYAYDTYYWSANYFLQVKIHYAS
ncbi:S8 family serine peptidase [Thermococcus sp. Bubb.Bath]|uniref:S8 family serine peptidase n=1 Tax=Thermococcus sp. Bubb.Bath TaxID=1638242 RepID=UPI00143AFA86|nr:S8 family serine peptidase [Thermococcus sp. Bubb.Bath]NJF26125.1 alkaline serine protease [Thermococcus sp. Bubb.Bath]